MAFSEYSTTLSKYFREKLTVLHQDLQPVLAAIQTKPATKCVDAADFGVYLALHKQLNVLRGVMPQIRAWDRDGRYPGLGNWCNFNHLGRFQSLARAYGEANAVALVEQGIAHHPNLDPAERDILAHTVATGNDPDHAYAGDRTTGFVLAKYGDLVAAYVALDHALDELLTPEPAEAPRPEM